MDSFCTCTEVRFCWHGKSTEAAVECLIIALHKSPGPAAIIQGVKSAALLQLEIEMVHFFDRANEKLWRIALADCLANAFHVAVMCRIH